MSHADVAALRQQYTEACARERWGEAAAVAVLLAFEPIAADDRLAQHVTRAGVDWDEVLAERTWSPSERFLIGTAAGIWQGRRTEVQIAQATFLSDLFLGTWVAMISAATNGRVPARAGGSFLIHAPTTDIGTALADWCNEHGLTFTALPGEA